jgi:hypothetical protein
MEILLHPPSARGRSPHSAQVDGILERPKSVSLNITLQPPTVSTPQRGAPTHHGRSVAAPCPHIIRICAILYVDLPAILCYTTDCDPNHDPNVGIVPRRVSGDFTLDCLGGEARQRLWSLMQGRRGLRNPVLKEGTMTQTERDVQRCPNCGAEWRPTIPTTGADITCPVCFYHFEATAVGQQRAPFSVREFAEQISALINRARTEGLSNDVITKVLRDELAYNAELANPSHTFHVQIVDLGPAEGMTRMLPPNEARIMVQRRSTPIIKR